MRQLVISKIEVYDNGVKHMECSTSDLRAFPSEFEKHPKVICLLGDYFYKYHTGVERNIVHYRTRS